MKLSIDSGSPTPLYQQIAEALRDQIARGALASGALLPTRRTLARSLGIDPNTVGRAYRLLQRDGLLRSRPRAGTRVCAGAPEADALRRARLQLLTARMIGDGLTRGYSLAELEAAFIEQREWWRERRRSAAPRAALPTHVLGIGSQDATLEVLLAELRGAHPDHTFEYAAVGSLGGLMALARGEVHFAAAHLYDTATEDYNVPFVRQLMPHTPCALVTLAHRTQGLLVARGNPRRIRTVRDLARRRVRFANRQAGSGTRALFDRLLREARLAPQRVSGYADELPTHTSVAAAVAGKRADAGLGIEAAARAFDLDFVPLARERYEIVAETGSALVSAIRAIMRRKDFRAAVSALGGYDLSECGAVRFSDRRGKPLR